MTDREIAVLARSILITIAPLCFGCNNNDIPDPKLSFGQSATVNIIEGSLPDIVSSYGPAVWLDRPAENDVSVFLEFPPSAAKINEDFTVSNPIVILKGQLSASVGLQFIDDKLDEPDETGALRILRAEGSPVSFDTLSMHFVIIDDDNADLGISLLWGMGGNTGSDQVDMDLYLWRETSPGSGSFEIVRSMANRGPSGFEGAIVGGLEKDGRYGLSCVYYNGNSDNFSFRVIFTPVGSAILEGGTSPIEITPVYNTINVNKGSATLREIYFTKAGFQFKDVSKFVVPGSGS